MNDNSRTTGVVYSMTTVHVPADDFAAEAPYQIALADFADGRKLVRIQGPPVSIGDQIEPEGATGLYRLQAIQP
jgi:uncharacterized OB-fold protein